MVMDYVKDTNNLYNYNVWSCTEYNNNTEGFDKSSDNVQLIPSNDFSSIGENSLKITCAQANEFMELQKITGLTEGKIFTISLVIYNPSVSVRCRLKSDNNSNITTITVPSSDISKNVSVTGVIPVSYGNMGLRMFIDGIGSVYVDNIISTVS